MQVRYRTSLMQNLARIVLGSIMVFAGIGHLSFARIAFQAQVPEWIPFNKDLTVLLSGLLEILLGMALLFWKSHRIQMGFILAIFFVLIFPGNLAQYLGHRNAFGLNTDSRRLLRLCFQAVLIVWALWSTGAWLYLFARRRK
ncbi:hypothetical protein [Pedobacter aquatilis]|uniref:DoxX family protein n=1 Tax=Pedobacter aquatilis TaxID=351343 RepID=UPI002930D32B|nr:hypothetical protein [Pedobacter aquatilis]